MAFAVERFGGLDVLCNIAGVSGSLRRFLDDDLRDFERVVAVDLFGVMACSRAAALHMAGHGGGAIVNIASGAGTTPGVGMLPYRAAKAGVAHFTRCLAVELGEHGIRANCIAPANIATDINAAFDKSTVTRLQPLPHQGRTRRRRRGRPLPRQRPRRPRHRRRPRRRRRHVRRHATSTLTHLRTTRGTATCPPQRSTHATRPGDWVDTAPGLDDIDFDDT